MHCSMPFCSRESSTHGSQGWGGGTLNQSPTDPGKTVIYLFLTFVANCLFPTGLLATQRHEYLFTFADMFLVPRIVPG